MSVRMQYRAVCGATLPAIPASRFCGYQRDGDAELYFSAIDRAVPTAALRTDDWRRSGKTNIAPSCPTSGASGRPTPYGPSYIGCLRGATILGARPKGGRLEGSQVHPVV